MHSKAKTSTDQTSNEGNAASESEHPNQLSPSYKGIFQLVPTPISLKL